MSRLLSKVLIATVVLVAGACNRPSEESCREAVANIQRIAGTAQSEFGAEVEAAVRSCQGRGTKESVECMVEAQTLADLKACEGGVAKAMFGEDPSQAGESEDTTGTTEDTAGADTKATPESPAPAKPQ